jgi:hypothetical protein
LKKLKSCGNPEGPKDYVRSTFSEIIIQSINLNNQQDFALLNSNDIENDILKAYLSFNNYGKVSFLDIFYTIANVNLCQNLKSNCPACWLSRRKKIKERNIAIKRVNKASTITRKLNFKLKRSYVTCPVSHKDFSKQNYPLAYPNGTIIGKDSMLDHSTLRRIYFI